jgi:hypothetical protein
MIVLIGISKVRFGEARLSTEIRTMGHDCVTTVHNCVFFNGIDLSPFHPSRVLCQGDPLSPYLFLLVADCLSTLMKSYEKQGLISGIRVSRRAPSITHLLFADDSMLFFKLGADQANRISELLALFAKGTRQKLSLVKCSLLVWEGSDQELITTVRSILNVERDEFDARYLRLPMPEGRIQGGVFMSIEERYVKKMADWKEQLLSQVAKEVLIKDDTPVYVMSIFKILFGVCDELEKQTRVF